MICSSLNRFFTSDLLLDDRTLNATATQFRGRRHYGMSMSAPNVLHEFPIRLIYESAMTFGSGHLASGSR